MARKDKKSLFTEFKEFAFKGNVVDMAVGVVIGGAFTSIVSSLVADIITPVLGLLTGGTDFSQLYLALDGQGTEETLEEAQAAGRAVMTYGNFIQAIINFFLIAIVIFLVVKLIKAADIKAKKEAAAAAEAAEAAAQAAAEEAKAAEEAAKALIKVCPYCLSEINVNATRCPHCTSEQPKN